MFAPHLSEIVLERTEPFSRADVERSKKIIRTRFERIATRAVEKELISIKRTSAQVCRARKKYHNMIQFDIKKWSARAFVDAFNRWREHFLDRKPWKPKNIGQLKIIDSINAMLKDNEIDKDVFLVCCFIHVKSWKFNTPSFSMMLGKGLDIYNDYVEDALAEIDRLEYYDR